MNNNNNSNPISGFITSLLNLALVIIIIKALIIYAEHRDSGKPINVTKIISSETRVFVEDVKSGWSNEKDSVK